MSTNGTTPTADRLEADIARQREQLADTVDALQASLDARARAAGKVAAAVAGAVVVVAAFRYLRRRRR